MTKVSQHKNFDVLLLEAVDEGLSVLGQAGKTSIYINLEGLFNIRKTEIPNKIEDFSNALHRIFGLGAPQMEILIMKKLQEKVGERNKLDDQIRLASNLTFAKYIELMRLYYRETGKRQK